MPIGILNEDDRLLENDIADYLEREGIKGFKKILKLIVYLLGD